MTEDDTLEIEKVFKRNQTTNEILEVIKIIR